MTRYIVVFFFVALLFVAIAAAMADDWDLDACIDDLEKRYDLEYEDSYGICCSSGQFGC